MKKLPIVPSTYPPSEYGDHTKRRKHHRRVRNRDERKYTGNWKPEDSVATAYKKGDNHGKG